MKTFIALIFKNDTIVYDFDTRNQEIIEKVEVTEASKKLVAADKILSVSENHIVVRYAHNRVIYWECLEDYGTVKRLFS